MSDTKKQQILGLGRLGWTLRQIEEATGIRRETASGYLKAAGIEVRGPRLRRLGANPASCGEVSTDFGVDSNPASQVSTDSAASHRQPIDYHGAVRQWLHAGRQIPALLGGFRRFNRYDPTFVATNGQEDRQLPTKWNTLSATGGIGWDLPVPFVPDLKQRPIFNFSLGHVASDSAAAARLIGFRTGRAIDFLHNGRLNAYGLGGSVVLDLERYREAYELDVELRYTNILLQSFGDSSSAVKGSADAETVSLWVQWRQPTGLIALRKPLRYVLEFSNTTYLGDEAGVLGFNYLNSVGAGFELDTSGINLIFTPVQLVARYLIGDFHDILEDVRSGTKYNATAQASEKTWVEPFLVLTLPWAARGHRTTMQRVGDSVYDQFYQEGAFTSDARQKKILNALQVERLDGLGRKMVLEPEGGAQDREGIAPDTPPN